MRQFDTCHLATLKQGNEKHFFKTRTCAGMHNNMSLLTVPYASWGSLCTCQETGLPYPKSKKKGGHASSIISRFLPRTQLESGNHTAAILVHRCVTRTNFLQSPI